SFQLAEQLPQSVLLVSESGISDPETVKRLRTAGYRGFLIGETFMKTENPGDTLKDFITQLNLLQ
ncbi:Indole-3-glycerol phosphate synthase, partial [termite gut metagenome]